MLLLEGECTALQTAALPPPVLEAGRELLAWGPGCPLACPGWGSFLLLPERPNSQSQERNWRIPKMKVGLLFC